MKRDDLTGLWQAKERGCEKAREALIARYLPLVGATRRRRFAAVRGALAEELEAEGRWMLVRCVDEFEPGRGVAFESFAITKIWGAMAEWLRKDDWTPRRERAKERAGAAALIYEVVSLEALFYEAEGNDGLTVLDTLPSGEEPVGESVPAGLEAAVVASLVDCLPRRLKKVVRRVYWDDLTLKTIAGQMALSESRVHQLHAEALWMLKAQLTRWRPEHVHG